MSCDPIKPSTSEDALVHVSPVLLGIKNQDEIPICGGADSTEYYWCLASQQSTSHHLVLTLSLQLLSPLSLSVSLFLRCLASSASTYLYWHGGGGIIIIVSDCDPSTEREMLGGNP